MNTISNQQYIESTVIKQKVNQMKLILNRLTVMPAVLAVLLAMVTPSYAAGFDVATLKVKKSGIYELGIQSMADAGIDLRGVDFSRFGLTSGSAEVALEIIDDGNGQADFGDTLRFIGQGVDTLYTDQRVYTLKLDAGIVRIDSLNAPIPSGPSAPSYMARREFSPQTVYSLTSPSDDPWYALRLLSYDTPADAIIQFDTDNFVSGSVAPRLSVKLWGESSLEGPGDDHRVEIYVNNRKVSDATFDGVSAYQINQVLANNLPGSGTDIKIRLPGDTGFLFDIVNIDEVSLSYPRRFLSDGNALMFNSPWPKYRVGGFESSDLAAYGVRTDGQIYRIKNLISGGNCSSQRRSCEAVFGGVDGEAQYYVVTRSALLSPEISFPLPYVDIESSAEVLVISHPDFIDLPGQPLETYIAQLNSEIAGGAVLVDVEQIYAQYSDGQFDAMAISDYIKGAYQRGAKSIVLVGGDVFDYRDYKNNNAVSYIPSLYVATNEVVRFTPSDPKYADIDDDNVPDMVIARIPVRSATELSNMLYKRQAYLAKSYDGQVLFASDKTSEFDRYDFSENSDELARDYFSNWDITRAYLDDMAVEEANQRISSAINGGVALTVYMGHSSANQLSFYGLFDGADAASLNNIGSPTVITQWGCWNTYNINPETESMSRKFLLEGRQGAVSILGSSVVVKAVAQKNLADLFYAELTQGQSLGDALLAAKQAYNANYGPDLDVLLGVTEMGFPHISVK